MSRRWTVMGVLRWTSERFAKEGLESPRLDAELLLAQSLGVDRVRLYLDHDKPLGAEELARYREAVRRRLDHEPVAYILGKREFWSLPFEVDRRVLIPRPETELLVEQALAWIPDPCEGELIVDVGTGSGAIAVVLAKERPGARVVAIDCEGDALALAQRNAQLNAVTLELKQGDLLRALPEAEQPQWVVANLPYITSAEMKELLADVAEWEPAKALDGGPDGLHLIRALVAQAAERLTAGGGILLEIGFRQGEATREILAQHGFSEIAIHQDLADLDRVVSAKLS